MKLKKWFLPAVTLCADMMISLLLLRFVFEFIAFNIPWDFVEYENWTGELENPIRCTFGAGSVELTLCLCKLIVFVVFEIIWAVKYKAQTDKKWIIVAIIAHVVLTALLVLYVFRFGQGGCIIMAIKYLTSGTV